MSTNNTINWFEIPVTDIERAAAFYGKVLQTELKHEVIAGIPNAIFLRPDPSSREGTTGALFADPKRAPSPGSSTVVYLGTPDVAAALVRASEHGGKVIAQAQPIGPFGTIGVFADLDGNVVGLHTPPAGH